MPERVAMPITPVPLPPLRTQGLTSEQFVAQFEAFMLAFYQSVQDYNAAAFAFQLSVTATSTTSNSIGEGLRTFTVPSGLGFVTGMALRAANSGTNFMTGDVVSYSGTTLVINVTSVAGSGTHTSWTISLAAVGANSAGSISNTPAGNISATNVQAAINELDTEKLSNAPGAVTSTNLDNVVTGGTVGSSNSVPIITFNAKGRITGASSAVLPTPVLSAEYNSGEQAITSGGALTLTHGLGAMPKLVQVMLICKTAEFGYAINDVIAINPSDNGAVGARGLAVVLGESELTIRFGAVNPVFAGVDKGTGAFCTYTNANWRLIVAAFA